MSQQSLSLIGRQTDVEVAGAMANVDTEPLDGVDYKNGVLAYITLVSISLT